MINSSRMKFTMLVALCAGLGLASPAFGASGASSVEDRVLSSVSVQDTQACASLTISFNVPVQIVSHFPLERSDALHITIRSIDGGRFDRNGLSPREDLRPPRSRRAGVREIQFESNGPSGPELYIGFRRKKYYQLSTGDDFRSIIVKISDKPIAENCTGTSGDDASSTLFSVPTNIDANAVYAINILSQQTALQEKDIDLEFTEIPYALYSTRFEKDSKIWYRLRLGFFPTKSDAQKTLNQIQKKYGDAWIARTSADEREAVYQAWIIKRKELAAKGTLEIIDVNKLPENEEAAALVLEAKKLMKAGSLARAIQLLTKALQYEENASSPIAKELLGLAREKNGQKAHAKAEYEEYLQKYPDSDGAMRVRQRLAVLISGGKEVPKELRLGTKSQGSYSKNIDISLSQYYLRDESTVTLEQPDLLPDPEKQLNQHALISGLDVNASISNDRMDGSFRLSGSLTNDFRENGRGDYGTLSSFYVDMADAETRMRLRLGRQTRSTGGVLGRFDGALLSYDANENISVNLVAGSPVLRSRDLFIDSSRKFFGASVDLEQFFDGFDATFYVIDQKVDDLVDRRAVGMEMRYVDENKSAFGLIDYDIFYDSLNLALFNGSYKLPDKTTINLTLDYRYAPALYTINAIQGQGVDDISQLRNLYSDEVLYYLAESRSARASSGALSVSRPLNEKFQFNGGITLAKIGSTIDAAGVSGQPGTGVDKFFSAQLLGTSLIKEGDLASFGIRYDDTFSSNRVVFDMNSRYPFSRKLRMNPRVRLAFRNSKTTDQEQVTLQPSFRLNYLPKRRFHLELEAGAEWTRTTTPLDTEKINGYFINGGYRLDM